MVTEKNRAREMEAPLSGNRLVAAFCHPSWATRLGCLLRPQIPLGGYYVTLRILFFLLVDTASHFKSWVERTTVVTSTDRLGNGPFGWCGRCCDKTRGRGRNFAGAKRGR